MKVVDPQKGSQKEAALKDLFTSKDWMSQYRTNHIDIEYNKGVFSSTSSETSEPRLADEPKEPFGAPELPRSADLTFLLTQGPKTATSELPKSGDTMLENPKPAANTGFGSMPLKAGGTDWTSEYNELFSMSPVTTEELAKQANIPMALPDGTGSMPPSFDLGTLMQTSMDLATEGKAKGGMASSIDILRQLMNKSVDSVPPAPEKPKGKKKKKKSRRNSDPTVKEYVEPCDTDVLLGRGGRSNHHPGNKRYRDEVHNLQKWYKTSAKTEKTDLSQCLVNYIHSYGGRFLKLDATNGKWFIVTNIVARRKASQALREHMTLEERAAKKAEMAKQASG